MSVDRPTFSESWHRIADLRPRLRTVVQTYRQQSRGRTWHVVADPAGHQFFRVDEPGYHFIGLLDGRRTVAEAWRTCNEQIGDKAPTQGEAMQLLAQLHTSNLLWAELSPDTRQVFERHQKRVRRELGGYLMNFLFLRIPLMDPQRVLKRWAGLTGWLFSPIGATLWLILLGTAAYFLVGRWEALWQSASPQMLLSTENLLWLYLCFAGIKALHEFGHGFACVHFGRKSGIPAPVHEMGVMLLVLMPVPYVEASSSWMLRSKWQRAMVGAAGMYVELAAAAVAAIVWAHTAEHTLVHTLAYNMIFIASVSTLLFNANPLLRFDGYYILSDLLEIANLAQRSRQYVFYLVRKYIYGVRQAHENIGGIGERIWLSIYAVASTIYRVFICVVILLYIADVLFIVGALMALAAVVTWVVIPLGKFINYLATNPELQRVRGRATGVTIIVVCVVVGGLALIPVPDRGRAQGIVAARRRAEIHTAASGFLQSVLPSGTHVSPDGPPLFVARNPELRAEREKVKARLRITRIRRDTALEQGNPALVQALNEQLAALNQRLSRVNARLDSLTMHAPFEGIWVSPGAQRRKGVYLHRGERVGVVVDPDQLIIRVTANQQLGPWVAAGLEKGARNIVEIRARSRPGVYLTGSVTGILPAGRRRLPSPALGYVAGGSIPVAMTNPSGVRAAEPFFEIRIDPHFQIVRTGSHTRLPLRVGQRVVVRFTLPPKPLLVQWWRAARQLFQQRFSLPDPKTR